jgi:hypothetical protein
MNAFEEALRNARSGTLLDAKIQGEHVICRWCNKRHHWAQTDRSAGLRLHCQACGSVLIKPDAST